MTRPINTPGANRPTPPARNAIACFYASSRYGSEYRSGLDFIKIAWRQGFDLAIVSDVEHNDSSAMLQTRFPGLTVMIVPSPVRQQNTLYRFTDFLPQLIWHRRVAKMLRQHPDRLARLWINNGAQPWLPLAPYKPCFTTQLIWGPVGGGGRAPDNYLDTCGWTMRIRERLRAAIERIAAARKARLLTNICKSGRSVRVMARTREAKINLTVAGICDVPIIPEIVTPLEALAMAKPPANHPRLIWVGQDIPRKNLPMALALFERLRERHFPALTLNIHGVGRPETDPAITYHGWMPGMPWDRYLDGGVLLLTSYREGLPSVILEALGAGIPCISTDVGSIASLSPAPLFLIPMDAYPHINEDILSGIARFIREQAAMPTFHLEEVDHAPTIARMIAIEDDR